MTLLPVFSATLSGFLLAAASPADSGSPKLEIHEVGFVEELDAIKPDLRFEGWELRVALAPGAMPTSPRKEGDPPDFSTEPWRILYCDWSRAEGGAAVPLPNPKGARTRDAIGPLEFEFSYLPADERIAPDKLKMHVDALEEAELVDGDPGHHLFATSVPTPGKGTYTIRIYRPAPDPEIAGEHEDAIAEVSWKQDKELPARWTKFSQPRYVDLPNTAIPVPDEMIVPFVPSAPEFDPATPITARKIAPADPKPEGGSPIPGMLTHDHDPTLTISLAGSGIAIRLEEPHSVDISHFLARWWIEDKPVAYPFSELPDPVDVEVDMSPRLVEIPKVFTARIPFSLPSALKAARPDSKVSLQLLYCPTGTKDLPHPDFGGEGMMSMHMHFLNCEQPRLSNRLEFRLSDVLDPALNR